MSIDINWDTLTDGPDGRDLADKIRDFIDERFRNLPLPKLIRSVRVQGFDFGSTAPQIVIKDIGEPLADFYEAEEDDEHDEHDTPTPQADDVPANDKGAGHLRSARERIKASRTSREPPTDHPERFSASPLHGTATPGFLHGASNLGYFHLPLTAGLSGTNTPLAAVAGAQFGHVPHADSAAHHQSASFSSISPPPTLTPPSRPTSRDESFAPTRGSEAIDDMDDSASQRTPPAEPERSPEDLQIVFHVTYSGNVRLSMNAEVFLDYPMPSFVGIPLTINVTGLTFNGVGIMAYIKRKAHVCFLAPEDAEALVGGEALDLNSPDEMPKQQEAPEPRKVGGLIEDIRIESEMGGLEGGKQVLKNVGKIEKFLLEQVQRVFEDEFVYPSFWTFLV